MISIIIAILISLTNPGNTTTPDKSATSPTESQPINTLGGSGTWTEGIKT